MPIYTGFEVKMAETDEMLGIEENIEDSRGHKGVVGINIEWYDN